VCSTFTFSLNTVASIRVVDATWIIRKKEKSEGKLPERFCSVESFVLDAAHCKERDRPMWDFAST